MDIPTPAQVAEIHSVNLAAEVQAATSQIVAAMGLTLDPKRVSVTMSVSAAARPLLYKNFKAKGWGLRFGYGIESEWVLATAL